MFTPTEELTVYYGYSAVPLFGITCYNIFTNEKKYVLPTFVSAIDSTIRLASMIPCKSFSEVIEMFSNSYKELLQGNEQVEPEGFVVHIFDDANRRWFPIKYKFDLYYVAHKPNSVKNQPLAKKMVEEPQFASVIKRFMKFREKPTMATLLNQCNYTIQISQPAFSAFSALSAQIGKVPSKAEWVKYFKETPSRIVPFQQTLNLTAQFVSSYYPGYVEKVSEYAFSLLMTLYVHFVKTHCSNPDNSDKNYQDLSNPLVQTDIDIAINKIFS